jgi:hypothetical protein
MIGAFGGWTYPASEPYWAYHPHLLHPSWISSYFQYPFLLVLLLLARLHRPSSPASSSEHLLVLRLEAFSSSLVALLSVPLA